MSLQKIRYVDKLPKPIKRTNRSKWNEAAESMSRPNHIGVWAIVDTKDSYKKAYSLKNNLIYSKPAFKPYVVEAAVFRNAQGTYDVYARITGLKPKGETSGE
ncbi:hypothetical protein [Bifidobacterium platyrrhinorum]|uniref:Uncharacterized protein n=1 Tax=Bifidobacterium platyrrhinorum TaxID=2661628 RepID=A0A6L9SS61_9BIFI|nr:hypothetical protein [Bifidobacterium platyrrhinorum]NEG55406.1 hypothetical protein [Bifidobacterium platyrrhinorum]